MYQNVVIIVVGLLCFLTLLGIIVYWLEEDNEDEV